MTKQFTAKEFNLHPHQVFRAADKDGKAIITHGQYKDLNFVLTTEEKKDKTSG